VSVTVLLPVYNGAATLRQALDSILTQDNGDFELLVIDDASTDASASIISDYARRDDRISAVLHSSNVGLSETLNEGLARARHELVARMDQDDESLPRRLSVQKAFLDAHTDVAAAGAWVLHMGARKHNDRLIRLPTDPQEIAVTLRVENCLYHPSVMFRRSVVEAAGGYRGEFRNAEDYDLWLRLARDHELANVAEPLLRYRFSVDGMTLGRKWEQLFYVHLAQAAAGDPAISLDEATERAQATMAGVDRAYFMTQVALGTVRELAALHQWRDALVVARRFARDVGPKTSAVLAREIGKAIVRRP
jgi:glycosyltransferase involved in cell wall biosynthesis